MSKKNSSFVMVGGALTLTFFFFLFLFKLTSQGEATRVENEQTGFVQNTFKHPLTGFQVEEEVVTPRVYGVMIDNQEDAWPQIGLDQAFLVYEAPVEAGISRLLAFFYEGQEIKKIGPVRSARPYFLDWNNELDALYAHVGGSDSALDRIATGGTFDLNQFWFDPYFWRAENRYSPHNVYTSTELLGSYVAFRKEQGRAPVPLYESWLFKEPAIVDSADTKRLEVSFYPPTYLVEWKFDASKNRYFRFQSGSAHVMENGAQIMADNVAVMVTDISILDSVGRRKIRTLGEGEARVFQDGKMRKAIWKKASASQRLRFYDVNGIEIAFNPGVTWVEIIPDVQDLSL